MDSYTQDLERLRAEFLKVNVADPDSLRTWFQSTNYLTTAERSRVAGYGPRTLRRWRQLAGLGQPGHQPPSRPQPRNLPALEVPEDWDRPDWLAYAYGVTRSVKLLAKVLGVSRRAVNQRLRRYRIDQIIDYKQLHPCRNRDWLHEHYVLQKLPQQKCAKLAGVSRTTLVGWLREFEFPVRSNEETWAARRKQQPHQPCIWGRQLLEQLRSHRLVERLRLWERGMTVRFRGGVKEVYWFGERSSRRAAFGLRREDARLESVPPVYEQYPAAFGPSPHPHHLIIQRPDWLRASVIEQRLAVQELICRLQELGWGQPTLPAEVLAKDWERLRRQRKGRHVRSGGFVAYRGRLPAPGWPLLVHFFDLRQYLGPIWDSRPKLHRSIGEVTKRVRQLVTMEIIRSATFLYGPKVIPPGLWVDILRHVGTTGTVVDLHPGLGARAMACAVLGLKYRTAPDRLFEQAVAAGLVEFLGLDWAVDDGGKVDLVVADNGFGETELSEALLHAGRTNNILGFVPHDQLKSASGMNPRAVLRVRTRFYTRREDYLLLW